MYGNSRMIQSTQRYWIPDSFATTTIIPWREPDTQTWPSNNQPVLPAKHFYPTPIETRTQRSARMGYAAIRAAKLDYPEPLPERLYHRPKRKGRACGSRYRVML